MPSVQSVQNARIKLITKKDLAQKAIHKPSSQGEDVDLELYSTDIEERAYTSDLFTLLPEEKQYMLDVGVAPDDMRRKSATFIQVDHSIVHNSTNQEGLELLSTTQALKKYSWLEDYLWYAVNVDAAKFTAYTELYKNNGYFIRALPGVKVKHPVQACLYLAHDILRATYRSNRGLC